MYVLLRFSAMTQAIGVANFHVCFGVLVCALLLTACAGGTIKKPSSPKLSVVSVEPVSLKFDEQVFRFDLNAFNPNGFKLPIQKIDFIARISGVEIGQGLTSEALTLVPNGDTPFSMEVKTDLSKVINSIGDLFKTGGLNLEYQLEGKMRFVDGGLFDGIGIPFDLSGNLLEK